MAKEVIRVVTRGADGKIRVKDYTEQESLARLHTQIGIDDCSTDLALRGMPVFRGLIGPIPEGKNIVRYESPEVFEMLTKEWVAAKAPRRKGHKPKQMADAEGVMVRSELEINDLSEIDILETPEGLGEDLN